LENTNKIMRNSKGPLRYIFYDFRASSGVCCFQL